MAKGARASTIKANNSKLKSRVFGPVETARTERLSAKLLELASQPKPRAKDVDIVMDTEDNSAAVVNGTKSDRKLTDEMDIDGVSKAAPSKRSMRIEKRRSSSRKASIVFPKFKAGKKVGVKSKRS